MKKLLALVLLAAAVPAGAIDLGLRVTKGNEGYVGMNAFGVLPVGDFTLRPAFDTAKSDASNGTFKQGSLRVGYDTAVFGLGVTGGMVPKTEGYKNVSAGADLTFTLSATGGGAKRIRTSGGGAPRGKGLARVDVGAGAQMIQHEDEMDSSGATRATVRKISQTDVSVFVGASFLGFNASGNLTNSSYDKTLNGLDRPAPRLALEGLNTRLMGFPETSLSLHVEAPFLPLVNPFVGYNATTYKPGSDSSKTYSVGAYLGLEMLELYGAIERTTFSSSPLKDLTTVTVGGSLRFGLGA